MEPVLLEIPTVPGHRDDTGGVEIVDDLDVLVESSKCSCNAGDDNPY